LAAKDGAADTVTRPFCVPDFITRVASNIFSKASLRIIAEALPASVRTTRRPSRWNSSTPTCSSSRRICCDTAPGVTNSSSAACLKLSYRAAASNTRSADRGGKRSRDMNLAPFTDKRVYNPISV